MKEPLISHKQMLEYGILKPYSNIFGFSTTRHGGCGEGAYATFNCTHYCGDSLENVQENIMILKNLFPVPPRALIVPHQTHSTNVRIISALPAEEELYDVDAVITHLSGYCVCVSTADCIPVLLYDKRNLVVAAAHAGWRGTVGGIVQKTLTTMRQEYGTDMNDVLVCIGPGISLESFEVGDEVYESFSKGGYDMNRIAKKYDKWHIDLWEANRIQLEEVGVKHANIETAGVCTYKEYHDFFSARRLGIKSGRILSGIMLY